MPKKHNQNEFAFTAPKPTPKMPEGYYSGDKPNQNLRAFVEAHLKERPYDPETDDYEVPAFNEPITTTKATAIYNMHTYWSKKPHDAIRQYIKHYTKPGDLVLDPFCGSGGTALAALMEGRKAIAIDRSPAATFITKNYCTPVDVKELQAAFEELKAKVKPEMDWLYETRCDRCGGKATTAYTVYSQVFQCPRCLEKIPLFDCLETEGKTLAGKSKKISACPHCHKQDFIEEIKTSSPRFGATPVLVSYLCESGCKPARGERRYNDESLMKVDYFGKYDLGKLIEIEKAEIPYWYPTNRMMNAPESQECWGVKWRAGTSNFRTVDELFTKRNLWAIAILLNKIRTLNVNDSLLFIFQSNILSATTMQQYREAGGGFAKGTYYIPQIFIEREQYGCFARKYADILLGKLDLVEQIETNNLLISTENATSITSIQSSSVDYIFTDPPYADKVQYGELNFIWEAWLGFDTHWHNEEIIVNNVRGKTVTDWARMMREAMAKCYRVLKPGRWLSLCYHDTSEGTWTLIQDIMAEVGFQVDRTDTALFIDTGQKSYNQTIADKVTKRDLVINFRKPKPQEIHELSLDGREDEATFRGRAFVIIRHYLLANPGATKDRVYDEVVSQMVRRGQMEAFDFEAMLKEIAEPVRDDSSLAHAERWYLKEHADKVDELESKLEDDAAKKLGLFMGNCQAAHPEADGVHYSDLFERYLPLTDKPRRPLADWLWDYFYKTDSGAWRPPASEEERNDKHAQRATGSLRRIKSYAKLLESGAPVPSRLLPDSDRTLADWLRQARRAGLYSQGKLLFEKSGLNLSRLEALDENLAMDVNEDYQYCLRRLKQGQP